MGMAYFRREGQEKDAVPDRIIARNQVLFVFVSAQFLLLSLGNVLAY